MLTRAPRAAGPDHKALSREFPPHVVERMRAAVRAALVKRGVPKDENLERHVDEIMTGDTKLWADRDDILGHGEG